MHRDKYICKMDCEVKEVLKHHEHIMYATVLCLNCIHLTKQDNFVKRVNDYPWQVKEVKSTSKWKQFRNWARNG